MKMDIGYVLSLLMQLTVIIGGMGAGYYAFKRWVKQIANDSEHTANQLRPANGHTMAEIAEDMQPRLKRLEEKFDNHLKGHP